MFGHRPASPTTARRIGLGAVAWALVALGAAAWQPARAQVPGVAVAAPPAELADSLVLPDQEDLRRAWERLIAAKASSRTEARALGELLSRADFRDFFLPAADASGVRRAFRAAVLERLAALDDDGREEYELVFGLDARRALNEALATGDVEALGEIHRRYPLARAGVHAAELRAWHLSDSGDPAAAAALLERLVASRLVDADVVDRLALASAVRWAEAGRWDDALRVLALRATVELPRRLSLAGRAAELPPLVAAEPRQWLAEVVRRAGPSTLAADARAPTPGDGPQAPSAASRPLLYPRWSVETLAEWESARVLRRHVEELRRRGTPPAPAWTPLVIDGQVVCPTATGLRAFDWTTGELLWRVPSHDTDAGREPRLLWDQVGALATDGRRVFRALDVDFRPWEQEAEDQGDAAADSGLPAWNTLEAREVRPPWQGNLRWRVGGRSGEDEPRLEQTFFLGPPLVDGGTLYVLGERRGAIELIVLDAATGRLAWTQELGLVERTIRADLFRRAQGLTPARAGGLLICPSGAGGVVAVDPAERALRWALLFRRESYSLQTDAARESFQSAAASRMPAPLVDGDRVFLLPPESQELFCLDVATGALRWRARRTTGDYLYLAGVQGENLIAVGRRGLYAVRARDGGRAWRGRSFPDVARASGRGLIAGEHYLMPLSTGRIAVYDLRTGRLATTLTRFRESTPGHLVYHDGSFLTLGVDRLERLDDRASVERLLAGADSPPGASREEEQAVARAQLAWDAGQIPEALAELERVAPSLTSPRARRVYELLLQEAVARELPGHETWAARLAELARTEYGAR